MPSFPIDNVEDIKKLLEQDFANAVTGLLKTNSVFVLAMMKIILSLLLQNLRSKRLPS